MEPLLQQLKSFSQQPYNRECADCGDTGEPMNRTWISTNLGVFLCINCAGVHRELGTHISNVMCLELDVWDNEHLIEHIMKIGNKVANQNWLAHGSPGLRRVYLKALRSDRKLLTSFIEAKYTGKDFEMPSSASLTATEFLESAGQKEKQKASGAKRVCSGLLRAKLVKGVNLSAKGSDSSNPFISLSCADQTIESKVKNNPSPDFNQTLMLNIPEQNDGIVTIHCRDSNGDFGSTLLGSTTIRLDALGNGEECFMLLQFQPRGELVCIFEFTSLLA
eukprot:TRINITY_DN4626_c0_g1_i1.p1 TRINITY_DN4626_c0_g1~~TRINITY_DN4626_c0_g1_i1.p1  ORF type:complete len:277 (-),score=28.86 TRINITY_DN4626_c0_g1_i1:58-888(-)